MKRLLALALLVSACAQIPLPAERLALADRLATGKQWHALRIQAAPFELQAYVPTQIRADARLTVYIEGDGFAWVTDSQPAADPTPLDPLALRLALAQPQGNAAYLARPCQYIDAARSGCLARYWTDARFAPEVIAATNQAVDQLKQQFGARHLVLVGYSGGAAVAALVAARRNDVALLVTVAGNLDHKAWAQYHRISPLAASLNPADETNALASIQQLHLVGGRDANITSGLVQDYVRKFPISRRPIMVVEPGFDHHCCWADQWATLWRTLIDQSRD